jgi:hypothetical protein
LIALESGFSGRVGLAMYGLAMANYVAHYRKKQCTLARKQVELKRILERHGTEGEVAMAAEAVRESQIRALEAKRAQIPPCETNVHRIRNIDERISLCTQQPIGDIVASCRGIAIGERRRD